jgi:hypothetical protein
MSTTTTTITSPPQGNEPPIPQTAKFRYIKPGLSFDPMTRGYYALPPTISTSNLPLPLHNLRNLEIFSPNSPITLSTHNFTAVKHTTSLPTPLGLSSLSPANLNSVYYPEIQRIVQSLTKCRSVQILSTAIRTIHHEDQRPPSLSSTTSHDGEGKGLTLDEESLDMSRIHVVGSKPTDLMFPARGVHCDMTPLGASLTIRHTRPAMFEASKAIIDAEGADPTYHLTDGTADYRGPRYAFFSLWRPLKKVRRDPLAVADYFSIPKQDYVGVGVKSRGFTGDYVGELSMISARKAGEHRWYWIPEQDVDEVLVVKLFDSESQRRGSGVAGGTGHGSPELEVEEDREARESVEVRALALW